MKTTENKEKPGKISGFSYVFFKTYCSRAYTLRMIIYQAYGLNKQKERLKIYQVCHSINWNSSVLVLFNFGIVFFEASFIENYNLVIFTVRHMKCCNRENNPFPRQLTYFIKREYKLSIFSIHSKFVCLVCYGFIFNIKSTADYSIMAY